MFHHLTALFKIYRLDVDCSGYRSESSVVRSTFEPPNKVTWPIGMAIFIALLLGVGLSRYQARSQNSRQVYANFIVSVLEAKGHPVAGVSVYLNDRPIGVTDSHGEWRRFMAVESHRLLEIKFVKDGQSPTLRGNLHVAVPKADPSLEEFSVRRRILLSATDETDLMGPVSSPLRLVTTIPDRGPLPLLQRYIGQASVIKNADSPFLNDDQFQLAPSTLYELLFGVPSFTVHSFSGRVPHQFPLKKNKLSQARRSAPLLSSLDFPTCTLLNFLDICTLRLGWSYRGFRRKVQFWNYHHV